MFFYKSREQKEENKMAENQKKILEMLADKKISVDEAHRLLSVLEPEGSARESTATADTAGKTRPKYLRVTVQPGHGHEHDHDAERVNVRLPMALIRSGMKFTSLLPTEARDKVSEALREKGIDFDMRNLKPQHLDELIEALTDLEVDVASSDGETVKVFVE